MNAFNLDMDTIVASMAAVSVFCAVLLVSWPYLAKDTLGARMALMSQERDSIRVRERASLQAGGFSLRSEPKKFFKQIFERLNLASEAEDGEMVQKLRMAGYRGRGPVVTFLAVRVLAPFIALALAALYVFVIVRFDSPFVVKLMMVLIATALGYYGPRIYIKNKIAKRQQSIRRAWPDALDLLLICVESGMGIESAFGKVSEEIGAQSVELAEELSLTTAELSYFPERRLAYQNLAERTGLDAVRSVATSLIQSERYGTPVGQSLRVLSQESRDQRMSEAEKKAASLPPKLTVPMIIFFLPVLFAVIITPAIIQLSRTP
ncbi:MAG: type secretion system protein [Hyphomicrobiales bacterium]|nr:type secretion system protein [Hyphomicrobiales bacterium]